MEFGSIVLFFLITWGLGLGVTWFVKERSAERHVMAVGIGLAAWVVFGVVLHAVGIPVNWWVFALLGIGGIVLCRKQLSMPKVRLTKSSLAVGIVAVLFLVTFGMYLKGAFAIPYLEDDDPWGHATSIKYVALEKSLYSPEDMRPVFQYLDPYPPGYALVLGSLHQVTESLPWTMKFFNALIAALSIPFFFFFVRRFFGSDVKALFATFVLFALPSFLTHFIWAHSLIMTLFIVALYVLTRVSNVVWTVPAAIAVASLALVQPTQLIKMGMLLVAFVIVEFVQRRKAAYFQIASIVAAIVVASVWWVPNAGDFFGMNQDIGGQFEGKGGVVSRLLSAFPPDLGTATRAYAVSDYFQVEPLINNPVGLGWVVVVLVLIGLVFTLVSLRGRWITALAWLVVTFVLMNSVTFHLPFGIFAFRVWMLFAIPVSLFAAQGIIVLGELLKKHRVFVYGTIVVGVLITSFGPKFEINTSPWNPGGSWHSQEEFQSYLSLEQLPLNSKIFSVHHGSTAHVMGMGHESCLWCADEVPIRQGFVDVSPEELRQFLRAREYRFAILDGYVVERFGVNATSEKVQELIDAGFTPVLQNDAVVLLQV